MAEKKKSPSQSGRTSNGMGRRQRSETYPHFRYYYKSRHPALIVGEQKNSGKDEYRYRNTSHSKNLERRYDKVTPNPKPGDPNPMYIGRNIRHNEKRFFGRKLSWDVPELPFKRKEK